MLIIMLRKLQSNLNRSSIASIMNLQQKKDLLGGGGKGSISASLISSVSSLDQGKSILEIRKINYGLHLRDFKAT